MHLSRYPYVSSNDLLEHEFISEGPKGCIKKIVRYQKIGDNLYNLGFGDIDEITSEMNDMVVTNNNDSTKVLATVVATLYAFTFQYPNVSVMAVGSTPARTRLYQMGISKFRKIICVDFEVFAFQNGRVEPFVPSRNYESFLVLRK